jgi:hypothetical protein
VKLKAAIQGRQLHHPLAAFKLFRPGTWLTGVRGHG